MPFCSQCGNQVADADVFCARCGARQPGTAGDSNTPPHPVARDPLSQMPPRTASILCYVPALGWIVSIVVLASHKFREVPAVRFHAFQGLYLFVAFLLNDQVVKWIMRPAHFPLHEVIAAILIGMSIFMMVKAAHDEMYSLPLFGELAQRSLSES